MIRYDPVSVSLVALAGFLCLYFATFETYLLVLFPVVILLISIIIKVYARQQVPVPEDPQISPEERTEILAHSIFGFIAIGLMGMLIQNFLMPRLPAVHLLGLPPSLQIAYENLNVKDKMLYGALMAICEEALFRDALLNFTEKTFGMLNVLVNGLMFMFYHFAVYGTAIDTLMYVALAGMILAWVTYRTGRITPAMLTHIMVNVVSTT
mgnify:CR=1 FL=1